MLKMLFFKLFLTALFLGHEAQAQWTTLENESKNLKKLIKSARECIPVLSKNSAQFCTGIKISQQDFATFKKMTYQGCRQKINSFGYKVYDFKESLSASILKDFQYTSKRAQTYHDQKKVVFKAVSDRVDCIHELLHIFQRTKPYQGALNPRYRNDLKAKILRLINSIVQQVEGYEKNGDKTKALRLASDLAPYIQLLKEWNKLITWLDEKEIYYFIYENCRELNCQKEDWEIALANLFRLKEYFPWRLAEKYRDLARSTIIEKKKATFKEVRKNFISLEKPKFNYFKGLIKKDQKKLVDIVNVEGIYTEKRKDGIELVFCRKQKLGAFYRNETDNIFFLKLLIYKKQLDKNKELCRAFSHKVKLKKDYDQGKINLEQYEKDLLYLGLLRDYTDFESSGFLNQMLNTPSSHLNLLRITARLNFDQEKSTILPLLGQTIHFNVKDELPRIIVDGYPFILDLGAMNSVFPPKMFKVEHFKEFEPIATVDINSLYGRRIAVPRIINRSHSMVGKVKLKNIEWVLTDLKIPGITGLLGLDFFKGQDFTIFPQHGKISFQKFTKVPPNALLLQKNWRGETKALEIICPEGPVMRLDSGSQVFGDISHHGIEEKVYKKITTGRTVGCGPLEIQGKFTKIQKKGPLFARGVSLNLGWPWISQFKIIRVSLTGGWIEFVK